jgi:site-specific DNA recombinase
VHKVDPGMQGIAVVYARVSSKEQEKEGFSIPAQLKLLRGYAAEHRLTVVEEFVDVETAKRSGRPSFTAMVEFFKKHGKGKSSGHTCRILLVEKTDRLYRNLKDWVTLDDLDLEIHFVKENVVLAHDSRSSEKFMHGIKVLMAKNYIDNLSEETQKGMVEKAAQGIYPSFAPLGYRNVDGPNGKRLIEPDPQSAPFVRRLFEWYATGCYSLMELTKKARAEGLRSRTAAGVAKSSIHKILTNPMYCGGFWWAGKYYRGIHEPIVSQDLFDRVQEMLDEKGRRRTRQQKHLWAFHGLLSCGHCGCALTAEMKKGRYVYYHCTGNKGRCPEKYVREEEVAAQFGEALRAIQLDEEVLAWVTTALRESHRDAKRYHHEMIASLQKQYQRLKDRLDRMYIDKLDGTISQDAFDRMSETFRKEQHDALQKIAQHQSAHETYVEEGVRLLELAQRAVILYEKQEMQEKRKLINFVCSNSMWKDGRLIPQYRKPFDLLAVANQSYQQTKATSPEESGLCPIWLPVLADLQTIAVSFSLVA